MQVQAINNTMNCQPIRNVEFSGLPKAPVIVDEATNQGDVYIAPLTTEQKLDLACRLAAYYKLQCDSLKENGYCFA